MHCYVARERGRTGRPVVMPNVPCMGNPSTPLCGARGNCVCMVPWQLEDRQGRNVVMLVESIRDSMPVSSALVSRRMALEQVSGLLSGAPTPPTSA